MASTRFAVLLESGGSDREEALRIAFVGTFPPTHRGLTTFTESMVRSISQHHLTAKCPGKLRECTIPALGGCAARRAGRAMAPG